MIDDGKATTRDARLVAIGAGALLWAFVTLASAAQGQIFAAYHGRAQDWWPTLGYTAAIFSVWALLTPPLLKSADALLAARLPRWAIAMLWVAGYPLATTLHVALFVLFFWPLYGAQPSTRWDMVEPVFLANVDKAAFAYLAVFAAAHLRRRLRARANAAAPPSTPAGDDVLWIRVAGGSHRVALAEIDWIAAAGDYAEVHAGGRSLLTDRSLAALAAELPVAEFARIHRGAIVRLDRVREVRRLGHGDASLLLCTGHTLRLSRRYRENVAAHLAL
ncbi:LytR/AlgR family response regulator transcription factor [Sphingopyxis sp. H115]|uniref:LytR/AlgR family response regulator transcription factor n=1 Tax=Sphingopyxis sp. H115 TaxID=1759073 RepID=UPI0007375A58|nr:LytTR family DNA-binding domain-containing protein [Sphingopyxis sp. H115]KTE06008.1 hypothetical protein ATE71_17385 [Sphingopyxis sp. H115]